MSSMPAPVETAGRGTSRRTDTAWQSVIVVAECLPARAVSTPQPASGRAVGPVRPSTLRFAVRRASVYDRSSMVVGATIFATPFAGKPGAGIRPFPIVAPPRR